MRRIPPAHKIIIDNDEYFDRCAREAVFHDHTCRGRITIEHALLYAGKQVVEVFAYVPICEYAHDIGIYQNIGILDKRKNEYLALIRATPEDFARYPGSGWEQRLEYLSKLYLPEIPPALEPPF